MDARTDWRPRPALSRIVRATILSVPVLAGAATGWVVARVLPRPAGLASGMWWLAVLGLAATALVAVDRLARRALPLAWLLRLSVVFPDGAPSRLLVAFQATRIPRIRRPGLIGQGGGAAPTAEVQDLVALATALGAHDRRTRAHSERVRALTRVVGDQLHLAGPAVQRLEWAAFLHDIGKLSVPPAILNKTGRPDPEEWRLLARHPDEGANLAAPLVPWLGDWLRGVRDHHERWDGRGYPEGVAGADISLAGRIVSVTDAFETMTGGCSYKRPMSARAARRELLACAGTHFDPSVVRAFLDVSLGRLYWILGPATWLAVLPLVGGLPRAVAATRAAAGTGQLSGGLRAVVLAVATAGVAMSIALAPPSHPTRVATPAPAVAPSGSGRTGQHPGGNAGATLAARLPG